MKTRKIKARRIKCIGWVNVYKSRVSSVFDAYRQAREVRDRYEGNDYVKTVRAFIAIVRAKRGKARK